MIGISSLMALFQEPNFTGHTSGKVVFFGAIAPNLDIEKLRAGIENQGWKTHPETPLDIPGAELITYKQKNRYIVLSQNAYNQALHLGDLAIAMAGTATEQFVGLGKPAITIPGKGPQFNPGFAEAQSRHLGASIILVKQASEVGEEIGKLLSNPDKFHIASQEGIKRMGKPGAAKRIAECIMERFG